MQIKLIVTKADDLAYCESYDFDQEVITIGRDNSNLVYLPDPKRIVGRSHAKLERKDDVVQLIDAGSKNFTFLMGKKIDADKPYVLKPGDQFKIGDFIIKFEGLIREPAELEPDDKTVFDPALPNPFLEDAKKLAKILTKISEKYSTEIATRRDDELREALSKELKGIESSNAAVLLSSQLVPSRDAPLFTDQFISDKSNSVISNRLEHLCDSLLKFIAKLIKTPWNFRIEFIGQTNIRTTDTFSFQSSTLQELQEFLISNSISDEDFKNRVSILKKEVDQVMVHQLALIDGYKISINEGVKHILNQIHPINLKNELYDKKIKLGPLEIPYRYLPIFYHWKLLQRYQNKLQSIMGEDRSIIEKKIFRPGFIIGYLERMSSLRKDS